MVAFMMCPLAVETDLEDGPVSSNPSADWTKCLVAPKSNIASSMALTSCMASSVFYSFFCRAIMPNVEKLSKGDGGRQLTQQLIEDVD